MTVAQPGDTHAGAPQADAHADAPPAGAESGARAAAVWELCGIGRMPVPRAAATSALDPMTNLPEHLGRDALDAARGPLLAALDGGGVRERAAAVMLRDSPAARYRPQQSLTTLQHASTDPVVAAWAAARCSASDRCSAADLERWSELEPDNMAAWLALLAGKPPLQRESGSVRLLSATRLHMHFGKLLQTVLQAMPADVLPYLQMGLWIEVIGVEAALALPPMAPLFALCKPAPEPGSARQAECTALAATLMQRSDSLVGASIGIRIAELGGLPKARAQALRAELNVYPPPEELFDV